MRVSTLQVFEANQRHDLSDPIFFLIVAKIIEPKCDILADGQVRKKGVLLDDHADASFVWRGLALRRRCHFSSNENLACVRPFESGNQPQHCGFATPAGAQNGHDFASVHIERDISDGDKIAEGLRDPNTLEQNLVHCLLRSRIISIARGTEDMIISINAGAAA